MEGTTLPSLIATESPTTQQGSLEPVDYETPFSHQRVLAPFKVRHCWFVVHAQQAAWYMSPTNLYVDRLPVNGCSAGRVLLGTSWDPYTVLLAVQKGQMAQAFSVSERLPFAPEYSSYLRFFHLDPQTLASVRPAHTRLSVSGGLAFASHMEFDGHTLVVQGTKSGPFQKVVESGSGSHFIATFERFLGGDAPPSVVAY